MGSTTVLVVGENFHEKLRKYQNAEYTARDNPHFVPVDMHQKLRAMYETSQVSALRHVDGSLHDLWDEKFMRLVDGQQQRYVPDGYTEVLVLAKGYMNFAQWLKRYCEMGTLQEGEQPDVFGAHAPGWARVNARSEVIEVMERKIPDSFYDYISFTPKGWLLKPGAQGIETGDDSDDHDDPDNQGLASCARKKDIDLQRMRDLMHRFATERWRRAAAAAQSQPWLSFNAILQKYQAQFVGDDANHANALAEWSNQPAIKAIIADAEQGQNSYTVRLSYQPSSGIREVAEDPIWAQLTGLECTASSTVWGNHTHYAIDPLALPLDQYVQRFGVRDLAGFGEVVLQDGSLATENNDAKLFDSIADDAVLTLVCVKC